MRAALVGNHCDQPRIHPFRADEGAFAAAQ